jgi:hypothetical protein
MLAILALRRGALVRQFDQAAGFGCSPGSRRWEAAAIAQKRAIRMSIFIGRFTVPVGARQPALFDAKPLMQITFQR